MTPKAEPCRRCGKLIYWAKVDGGVIAIDAIPHTGHLISIRNGELRAGLVRNVYSNHWNTCPQNERRRDVYATDKD